MPNGYFADREIWKAVAGYEGKYEVSTLGRVKVITFTNNRYAGKPWNHIMKPFDNGSGYMVVSLTQNGKRKNHYVHRLVATAFLERPDGKTEVNHIDHNRSNNCVSNLEWTTVEENIRYSAEQMRRPKKESKQSATGEKYIHKWHGKYRVAIKAAGVCRTFTDLDAAIAYRDEVMVK